MAARLRAAQQHGLELRSNAMVIAQVWRDRHGRQANLARLLRAVDVYTVTQQDGRDAGVLLQAAAGTADPIDATVVLLAAPGDRILTSDPGDLSRLAEAAGRPLSSAAKHHATNHRRHERTFVCRREAPLAIIEPTRLSAEARLPWPGELSLRWPPGQSPGSAEPLHQVNLVVPAWIDRCAPALLVTEAGVEAGRLEGVGAQGHLVTASALDLFLGRSEQPGAQARPAMVFSHPQKADVAASAPGPPRQPRAHVTALAADSDAQQPAVGVASRRGVEGVDLLVEGARKPLSASLTTSTPSLIAGSIPRPVRPPAHCSPAGDRRPGHRN